MNLHISTIEISNYSNKVSVVKRLLTDSYIFGYGKNDSRNAENSWLSYIFSSIIFVVILIVIIQYCCCKKLKSAIMIINEEEVPKPVPVNNSDNVNNGNNYTIVILNFKDDTVSNGGVIYKGSVYSGGTFIYFKLNIK
ncbi:hypothetical protein BCR32DRAFT_278916 [Anaeromyces robustus]|uniref:Uncharacterized protein n=1 Tax=Anaeromyces robustus TaxID=1754192 RepID=A0A1Y1X9D0_9FUNG|nr:hypothetical protein BCR32DRAFT_278916 [Anaeromyces robustus]|eukprot:ORX82362.1 hypothetical protein BCR32DRAFT_278916 [Anaeromyces robustus]